MGLKENIKQELDNGELYIIPLDIDMPNVEFSLTYDKKYVNKTAKKFVEFILNEMNIK